MELGWNYGESFELSSYDELVEAGGVHSWMDKQYAKKDEKEKKAWEKYHQKMKDLASAS